MYLFFPTHSFIPLYTTFKTKELFFYLVFFRSLYSYVLFIYYLFCLYCFSTSSLSLSLSIQTVSVHNYARSFFADDVAGAPIQQHTLASGLAAFCLAFFIGQFCRGACTHCLYFLLLFFYLLVECLCLCKKVLMIGFLLFLTISLFSLFIF